MLTQQNSVKTRPKSAFLIETWFLWGPVTTGRSVRRGVQPPNPDPDPDPDPDPYPNPDPDPTDHGPPREACLSLMFLIKLVQDRAATSLLLMETGLGLCFGLSLKVAA